MVALFAPAVDRLGANHFRDREAASAFLRRAGWIAAPALCRGLTSTDPEIVRRSRQLLERYPPVSDVRILWLVFRPTHWVAGCESADLSPVVVDECVRRWRLYAAYPAEPWPSIGDWSEAEQVRAVLNFARMRGRQPGLPWPSVPWPDCLNPR
jgi:hypothetical protein